MFQDSDPNCCRTDAKCVMHEVIWVRVDYVLIFMDPKG